MRYETLQYTVSAYEAKPSSGNGWFIALHHADGCLTAHSRVTQRWEGENEHPAIDQRQNGSTMPEGMDGKPIEASSALSKR